MEMKNNELSLNEMKEVVGGKGGSPKKLPAKQGFKVYRIKSGDCLTRIANNYGTTADYLKSINPTIHNVNDITAGFYIYVPA
jgi:LysM repeat protein